MRAASDSSKYHDYTAYAIKNAGFEAGTGSTVGTNKGAGFYAPTGWTLSEFSNAANGWDNTAADKAVAQEGTYSYRMRFRWGASHNMVLEQKLLELPQGRYTLSAYVNTISDKDLNNGYIIVKDSTGQELARSKEPLVVNAWTRVTASFYLGSSQAVTICAFAKGGNPQSYESKFWFDNFQIVSVSSAQYLADQLAAAEQLRDTTELYESSLRDSLSALIARGAQIDAAADDSTLMSVLTPLNALVTAVKSNMKVYAGLKSYLDLLNTAVEYYKRTDIATYYTALNGDYTSGKLTPKQISAELAKKDSVLYTVNIEPVNKDLYDIVDTVDVDSVEASFYVGYSQTFAGDNQYVAYYDKDKNFCVAYRKLTDRSFKKTILNSKVGWDTHNYTTLIVDDQGYIHVSGNMHNATQIRYWRSVRPYDASEFKNITTMVGTDENSITYPHFMKANDGTLLFHYRQGSSGDGYEVYNKWNPDTQTWTRFLDKPMVDGEGLRNAYMTGPTYINGYYHLYWVWRSTADCSTNHDLSYARSKDLINWESARGEAVASPIVFAEEKLKVDAPALKKGNGMLNGVQRLAFDNDGNAILCNMKYDSLGNTQFYAYKLDAEKKWQEVCLTNWLFRFEFSGIGTINYTVSMGSLRNIGDGTMGLGYSHSKYGKGEIIFDANTLQPIKLREVEPSYPPVLDSVTIKGQYSLPIGARFVKTGDYLLRWETMAAYHDQKPTGTLPAPTILRMIKIAPKGVTPDAITTAADDGTTFRVEQQEGALMVTGLKGCGMLCLYSADGRMVAKQKVSATECRIGKPAPGVYLMKYRDEVRKFLVK
jgi:hypothetical protein